VEATPDEIETYLKVLAQTPRRLASASRGLANARLHARSAKNPWSANDILAHLRACADVWGKSIMGMLREDRPTQAHLSPRTWIRKTDYAELAFGDSLQAYTAQRKELLGVLKDLAFEDWSRPATIQGRRHTVFTQARRMALHEAVHCEQLEALLK
jgi:DinB family protein